MAKNKAGQSPDSTEGRGWNLRRKVVALFAIAFLAMVIILNLVAWYVVLGGYRELEEDRVLEDISRATDAFRHEGENLDLVVRDWAFWDDTYAFVADPDPAYIQANLTESTFTGLRIQVMLFLDDQGRMVYAKGVDLKMEREMPVPEGLLSHLSGDCPLLHPLSTGEGVTGLLLLPEGPFLVSSEPILTSDQEGPPRGVLIMGRLLDGEEMDRITGPYHLEAQARAAGTVAGAPEWERVQELLASGKGDVIRTEGSRLIHGYTLLRDIYGEPALILRVTRDRSLYRQGVRTILYFTIFITGFCLVIMAATMVLLERSFLRRISRLSEDVSRMGGEGEPGWRVSVSGNDEVSALARSINRMVELREEEERRFRSLVEHAQDIIVVLDREGTVTYQSPSTGNILGYGRDGIVGKNVFDLIHPEDLSRARHVFRRGVEQPGSLGRHELRFRRGDGSWCRLEFTGLNLLEDPAVRGMVVNARDITAQVEARERLERINRLFTGLGAEVMDNIDRIVFACREILGVDFAAYSRAEKDKLVVISTAPGEEGFKVVEPSEKCPFINLISINAREPLPPRRLNVQEHCGECPVGSLEGYGLCAAYPVTRVDKTVGFLSVFDPQKKDLSRDELETLGTLARAISVEEERLAHEAELKDFIDIASHELRHPITLMKGYAVTLRDYGERMPEETRRELLENIDRGADRLDLLIRELLDVSRIERGRLDLNLREVPLRPVVERALYEMEARGYRGRFRLNLPSGLSPRTVDPEKIQRVLIILLENAVNFSPPESPIELSVEEKDGGAVFSVLDRGPGVPDKDRERIFERFYQVEDVLHHSKSGMGMGLYIAREIVEAHGGKIWYEPRPGGGSVFRFTLR
ncbi:MAG: CHASE4 domain-containing protein [Actinomycetota bacterium]|nr:CHASE4 domain-containing protein [Actinomycetota bacterium]